MRDIKFRQRTPDGWHYWGVIDGSFRSPAIVGGVDAGQSYQYTGLKDKNGIEIYEGDILRHQHHKKDHAVVEWLVDGWRCRVDTPNGPRWHEFWEGRPDDFGRERNGYYEVIGNIMENPELLK